MTTGPVTFPLGPFTPYAGNPILRPRGRRVGVGQRLQPGRRRRRRPGRAALPRPRATTSSPTSDWPGATTDSRSSASRSRCSHPARTTTAYGVEDPRVTEIDGTYYLTYSGWDRRTRAALPGHLDRPAHLDQARADVPGLRHLPAAGTGTGRGRGRRPAASCRDPVDGRYLMYFGEGSIWGATSDDLLHWTPITSDAEPPIMAPRPGTFTDFLVEVGPPPLVTDDGLILLVHNAAVRNADGIGPLHRGPAAAPPRPAVRDPRRADPSVDRADAPSRTRTAWSPTSPSSRAWCGSTTSGSPTTASPTPPSASRPSGPAAGGPSSPDPASHRTPSTQEAPMINRRTLPLGGAATGVSRRASGLPQSRPPAAPCRPRCAPA